jgi:hypothetical protein
LLATEGCSFLFGDKMERKMWSNSPLLIGMNTVQVNQHTYLSVEKSLHSKKTPRQHLPVLWQTGADTQRKHPVSFAATPLNEGNKKSKATFPYAAPNHRSVVPIRRHNTESDVPIRRHNTESDVPIRRPNTESDVPIRRLTK